MRLDRLHGSPGNHRTAVNRMLSPQEDGYGRVIYDHHRGLPSTEVIERNEGWFGTGWRVARLLRSSSPVYVAVLEKLAV